MEKAVSLGKELLPNYCPLLAEEYIEGEEISYCIVGIPGKTELIRIDGRLNKTGFYLLELSTDVGLSPVSTMTQAFESAGYSYQDMFEILLSNAIINWECQNANT